MSWTETKLGILPIEFIDGDRSKRYPKRSEWVDKGVPFLNAESIKTGKFDIRAANFISAEKFQSIKKGRLQSGDLILTTRGNGVGNAAFFDESTSDALINAQLLILRSKSKNLNSKFFYYSITTPNFQSTLRGYVSGSAQPQLPIRDLKNVPYTLPDIDTQNYIASILSNYDDLIDNNNRRIALLEESVHRLYREWFVHLRFPGHERVAVVDGVPEGWGRKELKEIAILNYGKSLTKKARKPGNFPVYGSSGIVGTHEKKLVEGPGIIVGRKGNVGSVYWSDKGFYPIDTVYYIDSQQASYFLYIALDEMSFVNTDAAVPGLNRGYAYSRLFLLPAQDLFEAFEDFASTHYQQVEKLTSINERLREARDRLLPRLMNGTLTV